MQLIGIYFIRSLESYYEEAFSENMNVQANYLAVSVEKYLTQQRNEEAALVKEDIDNLVENLFKDTSTQVQVMDQNGVVLSTNLEEKWMVGQKNTQSIVTQALGGLRNEAIQIDPKTGHRVKIFAIPIKKEAVTLGAIYLIASMEKEYGIIRKINGILATATAVALLLTGGLGVLLARTITRPVKEITTQAAAMAEGDFNRKVEIYAEDEIGKLGSVFNHLTTQLQKALAENENEREKLISILANMSDGVMALDAIGNVMVINQKARQMLGITDEAIGKSLLSLLPPQLNSSLTSDSSMETGSYMIEWPQEDQGQLNLILRLTFTPLKGSTHSDKGSIVVLQDVTEQEKLDRDQKEFVANVSHELRTPLTTIKSYVEALEEGAWENKELAPRFLRVTRQETERMIRLVSDLLLLSRMDSSQTKFVKEKIHLSEMLEEVVDRFSVQLRQMQIKMCLNIEEGLPPIWVDLDRMDQVLDNLISNAIKYTPEFGEIVIEAKQRRDLSAVEVLIRDNGIGIPKKDLNRIFERFYRVDKARSRGMGGTGLGLSIAQEMIRAHGGAIYIESEIHKGTVVTFTIPYSKGGE